MGKIFIIADTHFGDESINVIRSYGKSQKSIPYGNKIGTPLPK